MNRTFKLDSSEAREAMPAHADATEYAPMLAILIGFLAMVGAPVWMQGVFLLATMSRVIQAIGILVSPTLEKAHPLSLAVSLETYLFGAMLAESAAVQAF